MQRRYLAAIAGLTSLFFSIPAFAVMSVPDGWYLEGNVGSTKLTNKTYPGSSSPSGIGGNANLGYKFMQFFAMEIGYSLYANTSIKDSNGTRAATDKHYSYDAAAKGILPISDSGFETFAKLGVQRINSHVSIDDYPAAANVPISNSQSSATGLYMGLGAQYYVIPELAIVGQWQRADGTSSTATMDLYTLGLSFIFD
jgi:hypothetical protein